MESEERQTKKAKIADYMIREADSSKPPDVNGETELHVNMVKENNTDHADDSDNSVAMAVETTTDMTGVTLTAPISDKLPEVFQTESLTFDERWNVLKWNILPDSKPMEVEQSFYYYVEENVDKEGWKAVWRSHQLGGDVLVEVEEIQAEEQRAEVTLVKPFCCECTNGNNLSQMKVEEVLKASKNRVSLLELYPVFDDSGELDNTAMALEHLRFFYDYIWRASDETDDGDYIYANRHLEQRMKIYYDVKDKQVSAAVAEKYTDTMTEYQQKYWQLKLKRAQYDPDSENEDEDEDGPEIPQDDMAEMTELCEDIETLMKTLEKLEDPVMRAIVMQGSAKKRAKKQGSFEQRHSRPNQEVITHLVAEKLTIAMIKKLNIAEDTIICQHTTPTSALECCYNGDTVLIFPGRYSGEGFYNLTQSVDIKGVGSDRSDVVIVCQEKVSIFVDCTAYRLSISDITFETEAQSSPSFAALDVRTGTTTLTNCVFKSLCQNITVSKEGTLIVDGCEIHGFNTPAIGVMAGGTLTMTNSNLRHCGSSTDTKYKKRAMFHSGLWIVAQEGAESLDQTTITLHNNKIEDTNGPGIWIEIYASSLKGRAKPTNVATDDKVASLLPPCIKWKAKDNTFNNNEDTAICVQYVRNKTLEVMDTSL